MAMGREDDSSLATTFESVFCCGVSLPCTCHLKMKVLGLTLLVLVFCSFSSATSPNREFYLGSNLFVCSLFLFFPYVMNVTTGSQVMLKQSLKKWEDEVVIPHDILM